MLRASGYRVDITPYDFKGINIAGFGFNRKARGVLDPIEMGILCLDDGSETVVLVTVDLIGLHNNWVARVRETLHGSGVAPERILFCATHNHSGPDTLGYWGPSILCLLPYKTGIDRRYMAFLEEMIAEGVTNALKFLEPVSLFVKTFQTPAELTRNDRKGGVKDDIGVALQLRKANGANLVTLLNFAAHPETLWEENHYISADYPGAFRRRIEELGGGTPLFFSAALGGMVTPNVNPKGNQEVRRKYVNFMGYTLAETTLSALESAEKITDPTIAFRKRTVYFPMKNWRFRLAKKMKIFERDLTDGYVKSEINSVRLGGLHILTAPGECTPELGRAILSLMSGRHNMLLCLGCDEIGYILTREQWGKWEYRYEKSMSLGRDTADILLKEYEVLLKSS